MNLKNPCSRLIRWRIKLEEYDYVIKYKSGPSNTNADALSRIPYPEEKNVYSVNIILTRSKAKQLEATLPIIEEPRHFSPIISKPISAVNKNFSNYQKVNMNDILTLSPLSSQRNTESFAVDLMI